MPINDSSFSQRTRSVTGASGVAIINSASPVLTSVTGIQIVMMVAMKIIAVIT